MKTTIRIENLKCHGCANTITKGIEKFDEVEKVKVNVEDSTVEVLFAGSDDNILKFKNKLSRLGYPEAGHNNMISTAKSYVSCAVGRMS